MRGRIVLRSVAPWALFGLVLLIELPVLWPSALVGDWFQFWYAGHLVATGRSPYDPAAWAAAASYGDLAGSDSTALIRGERPAWWLYPPWTALALAPFGALGPDLGIALFRVTVLATAVAAVAMAVRVGGSRGGVPLAVTLIACALSQPFIIGARSGHADGVYLIGAMLTWRGILGSHALFGSGVALAALKPHVLIVFAIACALRAMRLGRWAKLVVAASVLVVLGAAAQSTAGALVLTPAALLNAAEAKVGLDVATTWSLARSATGDAWPLTGALAVAAFATLGWRVVRRAPPEAREDVSFAVLLTLSLAAAPYAQAYDHLLLFPIVGIARAAWPPGPAAGLLAATGVVSVVVVVPWSAHFASLALGTQALSGLVPWAFLALLTASVEAWRARALAGR